jgi:hypothetical protein
MACFPVDECGWTLADKVREVVKMLLHHLKASDPRMVSFGGCQSLDLAREILGLKLQKENPKGQRWWKLNPDKLEQRLKTAGLCPATYELLEPDLWEFALERALGTLAERKAKTRLYKANERKVLREATKAQTLPVETEEIPFDEPGRYNGYPMRREARKVLPQGSIGAAIRCQRGDDDDPERWTSGTDPEPGDVSFGQNQPVLTGADVLVGAVRNQSTDGQRPMNGDGQCSREQRG